MVTLDDDDDEGDKNDPPRPTFFLGVVRGGVTCCGAVDGVSIIV